MKKTQTNAATGEVYDHGHVGGSKRVVGFVALALMYNSNRARGLEENGALVMQSPGGSGTEWPFFGFGATKEEALSHLPTEVDPGSVRVIELA